MKNTRFRATATAAALLVVAAIFCIYYYNIDPASGHAPRCLFKLLTGYDCPGCGSQRAFHALLHGHIARAWGYNPFVFFAVPAAAFYIVTEAGRDNWPRFHAAAVHPAVLTAILIAITGWWIGRNIFL